MNGGIPPSDPLPTPAPALSQKLYMPVIQTGSITAFNGPAVSSSVKAGAINRVPQRNAP
jgi:hypothetical protein